MAAENHFPVYPGWETVRIIGRGSFGAVYEIQRDVFGRKEKAALKHIRIPQNDAELEELRSDGYDDESITERFRGYLKDIVREYSLMVEMKGCSNVVYCDDVRYIQHEDGIGWDILIKMELLTPLTRSVEKMISEEQVLKLGADICNALVFCEKRNLLHRDIKPANIFVASDGTCKLGDFGIAKTAERTTSGTKTGTYKYMAPEVYNNQPYGPKADIYSLGLVLYWLLNERRTPFLRITKNIPTAREEDEARARRFRGEEIPAPAHGSPELRRIVLKACAFDPKERYQSAAEMLRDLERVSFGIRNRESEPTLQPGNIAAAVAAPKRAPLPEKAPEPEAQDSTLKAGLAPASEGEQTAKLAEVPGTKPLSDASTAEDTENTLGIYPPPKKKTEDAPEAGRKKAGKLRILIGTAALVLVLLVCFFTIHSWRPATCTEPETCSICGKTRGEALGHSWQPATCETPETCSVCGETYGSALGHKWQPASCTEPKTCLVCGATEGAALGHDWEPATFTHAGVCLRCGETQDPIAYEGVPYTEMSVKAGAEAAAADPAIDYRMTSEVGTELELPENSEFFEFPMLMDATGFDILPVPEQGHGSLGKLDHDETVLVVARRLIPSGTGEAELYYFFVTYNGRAGWHKNEAFAVTGDAIGCEDGHHWEKATCAAPQVCSTCGATQGDLGEHAWKDATCTEPRTCKACGKTEGDALGHKWIDATCEDPEKCERCGTERLGGKPATGHKWKDATCTEPEICENCGKEKPGGKALGHDYVKGETVPPTCTEDGYTPYTCTRCGDIDKRDIVAKLGHDWLLYPGYGAAPPYWICSRCGAKDYSPEKPPESLVLIAEK
jgi:serine/threonine protein kinase